MAVAYGSLVIMALIPIFLGAFRSVKHQDDQKAAGEPVGLLAIIDNFYLHFILNQDCARMNLTYSSYLRQPSYLKKMV